MRITSSIVTYKTDVAELQKCLACLLGDSVGKVYVCDNSPDDSLKGVCESYPDVTYIHLPENPGYGTAHNVAMRKAMEEGSTYHLVINSDVWFDKGVIASIAAFMDANPDVGQLAPKMLARDGSLQYSARKLPTPFEVFTKRFLPESFSVAALTITCWPTGTITPRSTCLSIREALCFSVWRHCMRWACLTSVFSCTPRISTFQGVCIKNSGHFIGRKYR